MWTFIGYFVVFIVGIGSGLVIEQKYDLLKPKHVRLVEEELRRLRDEIREWMGRKSR